MTTMNINLTYIIPERGGTLNEQNIDNELFKNHSRNQEEDVMDNNEDAGCYSTEDQHTINTFHSCNLNTVVLARG